MRRVARWAIGLLAAIFWYLSYIYLTLPDVRPLVGQNPTTTAFMARRASEARAAGRSFEPRQHWVPYGRISPHLKRAVIVAEDASFWRHDGIDYVAVRESIQVNIERMEFVRGASTITQQLAKNLYLSPSKHPDRKLRELFLARRLEAVLTKRRILEIYLNVIEWGDGVFGAEAASRAHFRTSAAGLGREASALLAGAIINPRVLNPSRPSPRLVRRQRLILGRMGQATPPAEATPGPSPPPLPEVPPVVDQGPPAAPELKPDEPEPIS